MMVLPLLPLPLLEQGTFPLTKGDAEFLNLRQTTHSALIKKKKQMETPHLNNTHTHFSKRTLLFFLEKNSKYSYRNKSIRSQHQMTIFLFHSGAESLRGPVERELNQDKGGGGICYVLTMRPQQCKARSIMINSSSSTQKTLWKAIACTGILISGKCAGSNIDHTHLRNTSHAMNYSVYLFVWGK